MKNKGCVKRLVEGVKNLFLSLVTLARLFFFIIFITFHVLVVSRVHSTRFWVRVRHRAFKVKNPLIKKQAVRFSILSTVANSILTSKSYQIIVKVLNFFYRNK